MSHVIMPNYSFKALEPTQENILDKKCLTNEI